ncbi:MAG: OmpA family protein [Burkholderiales bacterium]|nr:OmpA family protein [Burkholderiales bacterium]MDQ3196486.1 OmpA family protein [Pseudomonadota bacterium]
MRRISLLTVIGVAAATAPLISHSQAVYEPERYFDNRWYITPSVNMVIPDDERNADVGGAVGLAIGRPINPYLNFELRSLYEKLDGESGGPGDYHNWSFGADAQWFFLGREGVGKQDQLQPYFLLGGGGIRDDVPAEDKWSVYGNVGAGVVAPLGDWARLVLDARYRWDSNRGNIATGGNFDDFLVGLGLQIPLGPKPLVAEAPKPAPAAEPPPPEPAPEPEPAPPPPPPPAPKVTRFEIETDGTFQFDKAVLTAEGKKRIDDFVNTAQISGGTFNSIVIIGHTDPLGSEVYNKKLSLQRANAVRDYITSRGVSASDIRVEGRGESGLKITAAECKAKGQAKTRAALIKCFQPNRRVDVDVEAMRQE